MDLFEADKKLSDIGSGMNFYSYLTPVNKLEEEACFLEAVSRGEKYDPYYDYRQSDLTWANEALQELKDSISGTGIIERLLIEKIDFFLRQIMLLNGGDEGLYYNAIELFGRPDEACIKEAKEILQIAEDDVFTEETVSAESMRALLEAHIKEKGVDWEVRLSDKMVPKITVSGAEGVLYINSRLMYTPQEVERLKVHEVEVHIFRGANGRLQPYRIFSEGTAGYNETEEGLAIVNEKKKGVLELDRRQIKLYAGRAICTDLCLSMGFYDAYRELTEYFPEYIAYRLVERAKRGLRQTSRKGALTKGYHYISGFQKTRKYIEEDGDIELLYVGKIGIDEVKDIKLLREEGVLEKARYLPNE